MRIHRCKILRQIEYLRNPAARKKSPPKKARPRSGPAAGPKAASHPKGGKGAKAAGGKAGDKRPQLHIETEAADGPAVSGGLREVRSELYVHMGGRWYCELECAAPCMTYRVTDGVHCFLQTTTSITVAKPASVTPHSQSM